MKNNACFFAETVINLNSCKNIAMDEYFKTCSL